MKFSIIIPIYKEKKNLAKLIFNISKTLQKLKKNYEIIFVDDDSNDGSFEEYKKFKIENTRFLIRRTKPRDLSKSVVFGFNKAKYNNLVVMDGDLQHRPKDLKNLIEKFKEGNCDIVIGSRNMKNHKTVNLNPFRFYVSKFLNQFTNLLFGLNLKDPMAGFFIIKKKIFKKSEKKLFLQGFKILLDIVISSPRNIKINEVFINFNNRNEGFSKMRLKIFFQLILFVFAKYFSFEK